MREAARPSPSNQARVIEETLTLAQRENFRVNVIEAFDQPWKRQLEGSTGRYWGIFDRATGAPKFSFDGVVSDHPHWPMQALAGMLLAALTFAGAWWAGRGKSLPPLLWPRIVALALIPSVLFGWTIETVPVDSYDIGGWLRALAFAATAAVAPIACAAAYAADRRQPSFAALLGRLGRPTDALSVAFGVSLIALTLLSVLTALGLVFDPRYRDLPFAPQSGAVIAFLVLMVSTPRKSQLSTAGSRAVAETLAAAVLTVSAVYIAINETLANWQAVWLCAGLIGLAIILVRARNAPD
jgi:glucan 1,3-beta-glucosidase